MGEPQPTSRFCFVCGRDNPVGLGVRWESDRSTGVVQGRVTVPEHFNGYPGVVHGGIVTALLDETAGRSLLVDGGFEDLMVTVKLEVSFHRPTPTGEPLTMVGRLRRRWGRRAEAEAELRRADGTVTATATVVLARPPASFTARWEAERPFWRVDGDS